MAFALRRPFSIASALQNIPKPSSTPYRAFHQHASHFRTVGPGCASKPASSITALTRSRNTFHRTYIQPSSPVTGTQTGNLTQRLLYGAGIVGATILATNLIFNRETREDGGMPPYERSYLNETFMHTGLGVGIIGVAARALHQTGWSVRLMASNPWLVIGGGLAMSIGTMYGCFATSPDNYVQKYSLWGAFNVTQAALLSPLMFMHPALLARAGLYTVAMMSSIAFIGATAKTDKYLYLGGPLLAGVAVVAVSGFAPLVLPATAVRTLMWTENLWLWGGLAVFGGFTLYDVQKILHHARLAERGVIKRDAVNESISLELDFINIFVRMVQILGMSQRKK